MALIPGTVTLTGIIAPSDSADIFPVTDPQWGLGGLRTVSATTERDAIVDGRRQVGMVVFVSGETAYYQLGSGLTNSDWTIFAPGGTGGTSASLWSASTGTNSIITNNGTGNLASSSFSFAGGKSNVASTGAYSTVLNGLTNKASGTHSLVGSGKLNTASTSYSTIVGGNGNSVSGLNSFIGSGLGNVITSNYSVIMGGTNNSATTINKSVIMGGTGNLV